MDEDYDFDGIVDKADATIGVNLVMDSYKDPNARKDYWERIKKKEADSKFHQQDLINQGKRMNQRNWNMNQIVNRDKNVAKGKSLPIGKDASTKDLYDFSDILD